MPPQSDSSLMTSIPAPVIELHAGWKDYLALTKPRVISLLLFTTLATLYIASDAHHPVTVFLFLAVMVGGYMSAGAANTINMVIDRDIDARMERTSERPTVTQNISVLNALLFALFLTVSSFALLTYSGGILSAMMAMSGLLFYVFIYTLLLKRRTWHNIVIGGAAGAFPPLVGWAAVTHTLPLYAWYLFAIIFVWTPVHFWALALLIKEDYARAKVPMLPVVKGDRYTVQQIGFYTFLTLLLTFLPVMQGYAGAFYLVSAVILNGFLVAGVVALYRKTERQQALILFKYSMIYLMLLFTALAIDKHL